MLIPVILSGGSGKRLWPLSREAQPKPFIKFVSDESLLQRTFARAYQLPNVQDVITVTNKNYYYLTRQECETLAIDVDHLTFLLEPLSRNTAPAIMLATLSVIEKYGNESIVIVLPSDHYIMNEEAFKAATTEACKLATQHYIATFGITPTMPDTGYGYIQCGEAIGKTEARKVNRFIEKPDLVHAQLYLASTTDKYFWNAGIFCFKANTFIEECKKNAPLIYEHAIHCWKKSKTAPPKQPNVIEFDKESFANFPDVSVDYAVMEKSSNIAVIPTDCGWSDLGTWERVQSVLSKDNSGSVTIGDVVNIDSENNFIHSESGVVAALNIRNLVVINTKDALLIADNNSTDRVKEIVEKLKSQKHISTQEHRTTLRPWGSFTVIEESNNFKIKKIVVKAGGRLSLQSHQFRSEHWIVLSGIATVTNNDKVYTLKPNESTFIPLNARHRLENSHDSPLEVIEVQTGTYLGEDDIVRYDDVYGRTEEPA